MATIFYCSVRYMTNHHELIPTGNEPKDTQKDNPFTTPDDPATFRASQHELARDLVMKTKQVELLIASLPGIGVTEEDQKDRMRELEKKLQAADVERQKSIREKEEMLRKFDTVIRSLRRT